METVSLPRLRIKAMLLAASPVRLAAILARSDGRDLYGALSLLRLVVAALCDRCDASAALLFSIDRSAVAQFDG